MPRPPDLPQPGRPWQALRREVALPLPTALWVLSAHLLTILSPLVVIWAVLAHWAYLQTVMAKPAFLLVGAGLLIAASIFETAQNTFDRWRLTGTPPSVCDWLFNSLIVLSLACNVIAWRGDWLWLALLAAGLSFLYSVLYLTGGPKTLVQSLLGMASVGALYMALQQPVLWLGLLAVFFTLYFLDLLLATGAQSLHGFTTIANAVGLMTVPLAIDAAAKGAVVMTWGQTVLLAAVAVALALLVRPRLRRLAPTPEAGRP